MNGLEPREVRGRERQQCPSAPRSKQNPEGPADSSKQYTLGKQLANDATASGAHSNTNSGLRTSLTYSSVSERTSILKSPRCCSPAMFRATPLMMLCAWLMFVPDLKRASIVYERL